MTKVLIPILLVITSICSSQNYIFGDANNGVHLGTGYQLGGNRITAIPGFTLLGRLTCDVGFTWTNDNSFKSIQPRISYMFDRQTNNNLLSLSSSIGYSHTTIENTNTQSVFISTDVHRRIQLGTKSSLFVGISPQLNYFIQNNDLSKHVYTSIAYSFRTGIQLQHMYILYDYFKPNIFGSVSGINNISIGTFFGK